MSDRILVLYLLMWCVQVLSSNNKDPSNDQCSLRCTAPKLRQGEIYSKCTVSDPRKLKCPFKELSLQFQNVSFLDLSNNNLKQVPSWMFPFFKNLTILSLGQNSITTIEPGTFRDLRNLISLNLSLNNLREWKLNSDELQLLNNLDVTDNMHWFPNEQLSQLLQLRNLATIRGLTLTKYCNNCSLLKLQTINASEANSRSECSQVYYQLGSASDWFWHDQIQYGNALEFIKVGFWPTCLCDDVCRTYQADLPYLQAVYEFSIKTSFVLYATGSIALLANIMVVLVIAFNKSLRGDLAVSLVLNIAVCDILIAIFSMLYARYKFDIMHTDYIFDKLDGTDYDLFTEVDKFRNIMGPMLTCAVVSQVCGSLILTLEKFLKIVFALRPNARIRKQGVILFICLSWSLSFTFALLPVFNVGRMSYIVDDDKIPLPADQETWDGIKWKTPIGIAVGSQIVLLIIQLASFVLYLPIFIVAKRSGTNVGIKREATIARKIALLVFTNLIFFTIPVALGVFGNSLWITLAHSMRDSWQDHTVTEYKFLYVVIYTPPAWCMSINSVLNPFLYALRHPKIKQQLNTIISRCRSVLSECFADLRHYPHCNSNAVPQENDLEMHENDTNMHENDTNMHENDTEMQGKDMEIRGNDIEMQEKDMEMLKKDLEMPQETKF